MTHLHSKTPLAIILKEELKQAGLDIGRTSRILAKKRQMVEGQEGADQLERELIKFNDLNELMRETSPGPPRKDCIPLKT